MEGLGCTPGLQEQVEFVWLEVQNHKKHILFHLVVCNILSKKPWRFRIETMKSSDHAEEYRVRSDSRRGHQMDVGPNLDAQKAA